MGLIDNINSALTPKVQKKVEAEAAQSQAVATALVDQVKPEVANNETITDVKGAVQRLRVGILENTDLGIFDKVEPAAYTGLHRVGHQECDVFASGRYLHAFAARMYPADKVDYSPWIGGLGSGSCESSHVEMDFRIGGQIGEGGFNPFLSSRLDGSALPLIVGVVIKVNTYDKFIGANKLVVNSGAVNDTFILNESNKTGVVAVLMTMPRKNVSIQHDSPATGIVTFDAVYRRRDQSYIISSVEGKDSSFLKLVADNMYVEVHPVFGTSTIAAMWDEAVFEGDPSHLAAKLLTSF